MKILKGITWDHSRGFTPLVATAQRYTEQNPDIEIVWEKRSLQAFADIPVEALSKEYDLLVIDHPHIGESSHSQSLVPIDCHLPNDFLVDQKKNQVGKSHDSYFYEGHQWALALDAATPVASWRQDQFSKLGLKLPANWVELLELAKQGYVGLPAIPVDSLMNFYSLCLDQNDTLFTNKEIIVDEKTGIHAMEMLKELVGYCNQKFTKKNPIQVYETLVNDLEKEIYCPFAYGYTNYSRKGYVQNILTFGNVIKGPSGKSLQTVIGGAGIALSNNCSEKDAAVDYIQYIMSPQCQSTSYFDNGGQPGHRQAWINPETNKKCSNFFFNTMETLDNSYMRPRYNGYMHFQDNGCLILYEYLMDKLSSEEALKKLNECYKESLVNT